MSLPLTPAGESDLVTALDLALPGSALLISLALIGWIGWHHRPMRWVVPAAPLPLMAANTPLALLLPCLGLAKALEADLASGAIAALLSGPGGLFSAVLAILARQLWAAGSSRWAYGLTGLPAACLALGDAGCSLIPSALFDPYADYCIPPSRTSRGCTTSRGCAGGATSFGASRPSEH